MGKSIIDTSSVTRVGLDLAKRVFRVHAVDATGSVVIARSVMRALRRRWKVQSPATPYPLPTIAAYFLP